MRIAVFGTGGIGAYYGGRLAQAGEDVVFIARGKHLEAIREHGLKVDSVKGSFVLQAQATDDPNRVGEADVVILGVKAWQVTESAIAMRPMIGKNTMVIPFQNGVEAADQAAEILGRDHVACGIAKIFSFIVGPGHIRHIGGAATLAFAEHDNRPSGRIDTFRKACEHAGIGLEQPADIAAAMWEKFLFIAAFGGVGAVTRAPIGILRTIPETRRMLEQTMREVLDLAHAKNIAADKDSISKTMKVIDAQPADGTASMQRDIMAGRPSELDAWNGAVVRIAETVGMPVPLNRFFYHSLLPMEMKARGKVEFA